MSLLSKILSLPKNNFIKKSLTKAVSIKGEVNDVFGYYKNNVQTGLANGKKLAQYNNANGFDTFIFQSKGVAKKISKTGIRTQDLPAICAGIGTITPIPLGTAIGYGIGKLINQLRKL